MEMGKGRLTFLLKKKKRKDLSIYSCRDINFARSDDRQAECQSLPRFFYFFFILINARWETVKYA